MKNLAKQVDSALGSEGFVTRKVQKKAKGSLLSEEQLAKEKENAKKSSMTGLVGKGATGNREKLGQGSTRILAVDSWMNSLDKQVLYMEKTDKDLIERVKEAEKEKQQILKQHEINKVYQENLSKIKKEEKRHLKAAKNVPRYFQHNYEMDKKTEELLKP